MWNVYCYNEENRRIDKDKVLIKEKLYCIRYLINKCYIELVRIQIEEMECSVCMEIYDEELNIPIHLPCGHTYW